MNLDFITLVDKNDPILKNKRNYYFHNSVNIKPEEQEIAKKMTEVMLKYGGIGLAANQIGSTLDLFVMGDYTHQYHCFYPRYQIMNYDFEEKLEGCLTFPGLYLPVKRYQKIEAQWNDIDGKLQTKTLEGTWARCFQHECDHLSGILFTERVSKLKLDIAKRKLAKQKRGKNV